MEQKTQEEQIASRRRGDKIDKALDMTAKSLVLALVFLPQLSYAQYAATGTTFAGLTTFLKSITQLIIFEWGYYIGIITLAIQGYRWKTGRIDLLTLGGWGLGIGLVFFAPNIVSDLRSRSSGYIQ